MVPGTYNVLIMAANRPGIVNAVAAPRGYSHKWMIPIAGKTILEHVIDAYPPDEDWIKKIYISVEDPALLDRLTAIAGQKNAGRIVPVPSGQDLFASVKAGIAAIGEEAFPLIITTADNALHTREITREFAGNALESGADACIGMTPRSTIRRQNPEAEAAYAFVRFRGEDYSNCNIYAVLSPRGINAAKPMETGGQFGYRFDRVRKAFGLLNLLLYYFRILPIDKAMTRVSRRFGAKVRAIPIPDARGPIDVDDEGALAVVEAALQAEGKFQSG